MQPVPASPTFSPPVVLLAASAGGVRALMTVTGGLPRGFPAAVVVVLHRTPSGKSLLVPILARASALPVEEALAGHAMRAGVIYVARADRHLTIGGDGTFRYMNGHRIRHVLSSANPLFSSSAMAFGSRAIAVVLTGSGMDGTDGVQEIRAHGGTVIAQDESTSEHFGMPGAAIKAGAVDYVIPLSEIAPTLVSLLSEQRQEARA